MTIVRTHQSRISTYIVEGKEILKKASKENRECTEEEIRAASLKRDLAVFEGCIVAGNHILVFIATVSYKHFTRFCSQEARANSLKKWHITSIVSTGLTITLSVIVINSTYRVFVFINRVINESNSNQSSVKKIAKHSLERIGAYVNNLFFAVAIDITFKNRSLAKPFQVIKQIYDNKLYYGVYAAYQYSLFPEKISEEGMINSVAARIYNTCSKTLRCIHSMTGIEVSNSRVYVEYDDEKPLNESLTPAKIAKFVYQGFTVSLFSVIMVNHMQRLMKFKAV